MTSRLDEISGCYRLHVTYSEVDPLAYVHHAAAVIWFEQAREAFFRKLEIAFADLAREGQFFAIRELELKYHAFVGYQDLVEVQTAVTRLGRVNLDMHYRVDNRTSGKLAITGRSNLVAVQRPPLGEGPPRIGRLTAIRDQLERVLIPESEFYGLPLP